MSDTLKAVSFLRSNLGLPAKKNSPSCTRVTIDSVGLFFIWFQVPVSNRWQH